MLLSSRDAVERIHATLAGLDRVTASADLLDDSILLARIAAEAGVSFQRIAQSLAG